MTAACGRQLPVAILLASALTQPAEVIGIAIGVITARALLAGFLSLASGRPRSEVSEDFTVAFVASLPLGALVAIALTLYLLLS